MTHTLHPMAHISDSNIQRFLIIKEYASKHADYKYEFEIQKIFS